MQGAESGQALPAAVAVGAALLGLALIAVGAAPAAQAQGKPQGPAAQVGPRAFDKLQRVRCPAPYEARVRRDNYSPEEMRRARRWTFEAGGQVLRLKPPIDWRQDPVGSASFRGRLHDLRWLDVLFYIHEQTGNRRPLRMARRIAVDWVKSNPRRAPTTDRTWFDKVSGDRAATIGAVIRAAACNGVIRRKQGRLLLGSAVQHGRFLSRKATYTRTNRALFVDLGRLLLGRQIRFLPPAKRWRNRGERRFRRTVRELTFGSEAFWLEHSTDYQFLAINVIGRFLETPGIAGEQLAALVERMRKTAGLLVMPDRHWLQAGNSFRQRAAPWANRARREQAGRMIVKPLSGLAFVNHQRTQLSFLANFHSSIHKHSDDLSFDLFEQERRILSDTGMIHRDPSPLVDFQDSARAHTVLTVDGADFPRDDASAYGSGLRATGTGPGWFGIDATNPLVARQGVEHRRLVLYNRGYGVIVADAVRSGAGHTYQRYFQLGSSINAIEQPDGIELRDAGFRGYLYSTSSAPAERVSLARGEEDPLAGFVFPRFRERERRWTVELQTEGGDVDHVTTLALNGDRLLRAEPIGAIGPTTQFALYRNGGLHRILTVHSAGTELRIEQTEP